MSDRPVGDAVDELLWQAIEKLTERVSRLEDEVSEDRFEFRAEIRKLEKDS